jgi:hypothetical protein
VFGVAYSVIIAVGDSGLDSYRYGSNPREYDEKVVPVEVLESSVLCVEFTTQRNRSGGGYQPYYGLQNCQPPEQKMRRHDTNQAS